VLLLASIARSVMARGPPGRLTIFVALLVDFLRKRKRQAWLYPEIDVREYHYCFVNERS
jgi:hypothetical protein